MRKIFTDNLVKSNNGNIKWFSCVGLKVKFIYDNIEGEVTIEDVYSGKSYTTYLRISYQGNEAITTRSDFLKCRLGNLLLLHTSSYKYKIGDIIQTKSNGELEIIELIRTKSKGNTAKNIVEARKAYKYRCRICGNIDTFQEGSNYGCNLCSNKKVKVGYNDLHTTHPNLIKLLANPDDGYKYTFGSSKNILVKCENCGEIKKVSVSKLTYDNGFSCPRCGDGISYANKFIFNVLVQLGVDFEAEKMIKMDNCRKLYDFYIPSLSLIIEAHGLQHYKDCEFSRKSKKAKTLMQIQENDRIKQNLAFNNKIKHYVIIDCSKSEMLFIKNNILNSELSNFFDFSKVDWLMCHNYSCSSLVKEVSELWHSGIHSSVEIAKITKRSSTSILKYLRQGSELKLCDYSSEMLLKANGRKRVGLNGRSVICLNNKNVYPSVTEAEKQLNAYGVDKCCNGKSRYAGMNDFGEYLQWQYYDDYKENPKKLLSNCELDRMYKRPVKSVTCITTGEVFEKMSDAANLYSIPLSTLSYGLKNKKSAGTHPITGEPLMWIFNDK